MARQLWQIALVNNEANLKIRVPLVNNGINFENWEYEQGVAVDMSADPVSRRRAHPTAGLKLGADVGVIRRRAFRPATSVALALRGQLRIFQTTW